MDNNNAPLKVELKPLPLTGDPMVFSTFSLLFCGNLLGWFGENATFTIGVTQLCLAGLFMICAHERAKYVTFWGNMNLIFAFFFGVLGGTQNTLTGLGIALDPAVTAIPNLIAGIVLCGTLPGTKKDPWTFFVIYLASAIAVMALAFSGFGILPSVLNPIAAYCLLVVAILGTYAVIVNVNACSGLNLPLGKALFK